MIKRATCAAIALLFASGANAATVLFKDYRTPKDEITRSFNKLYLDGLKEGLITFSVVLAREGISPLFCVPQKLALTVDQADDILMREAMRAKTAVSLDDIPISIILLAGLRNTFPCGGQSK
jgi:hypothetical protein